MAQGFGRTPKWARALEGLLEKATPDQFFFKQCFRSKIEPEIINGNKVKGTFIEWLYLLGVVLGPGLAK